MPKFFDKLWGSGPVTINGSLNLSLLGVPAPVTIDDDIGAGCFVTQGANPQELFSIQFNTCFAAAFNAAVPLGMFMLSQATVSNSSHLNLSMNVPTSGTSSSVMPIIMNGAYRTQCSNPLAMVINSHQSIGNLSLFMNNQTTGNYVNSLPLNLTIRWNPANELMMMIKGHGTQVVRTAPAETEDGMDIELEDDSDTLGVPFPLPLFMPGGNLQTNTFNVSMPVVHGAKNKVITLTTRGF